MLSDPIRTAGGLIAGVVSQDGAVTSYKGIPFAAPPIGALRWREPQAAMPWTDVLIADRFGCACMQPLHAPDHFMAQFGFADIPECGLSEYCLFLNVWAPTQVDCSALPVSVWVYGGGHRSGSGSHPVSDGEALARKGAVIVTLNYRLGALGYLAHPELTQESGCSGNYACLDVLAALRWVQNNIAAFGGNPDCVTLFGQSAGGAIVNVLMASPLSQGLFHRAIVHSAGRFKGGPMGNMKTLTEAEQEGVKFMESCGAKTLDEMRKLPADAMYGTRGQWSLIIDGAVLREPVQQVFEGGAQLPIPLLVGFTRDDATPFPMPEWHTQQGLLAYANKVCGANINRFRELYPFNDDAAAQAQSYAVRRDISFAYQPWRLAQLHNRTSNAPTYLFEFNRAPPLPQTMHFHEPTPINGFGAYHGAELWYVFNTLHTKPWAWTAQDRQLAEAMSSYWLSFSADGIPCAANSPSWPLFDSTTQTAMLFGETIVAGSPSNQAQMEFFADCFGVR